ncbi:hypothetical protein EW146_g10252 [Bondarzewia mesenterica]|uniref:Uncharacterized protein n=1 Tax=Bondarzewia mesenterica TaxID=1095465 RepID=A0A4S4L0V2_9AGAM|nr:hypothetical protein EW146_g10252 [Bondarzewia mesenterica]
MSIIYPCILRPPPAPPRPPSGGTLIGRQRSHLPNSLKCWNRLRVLRRAFEHILRARPPLDHTVRVRPMFGAPTRPSPSPKNTSTSGQHLGQTQQREQVLWAKSQQLLRILRNLTHDRRRASRPPNPPAPRSESRSSAPLLAFGLASCTGTTRSLSVSRGSLWTMITRALTCGVRAIGQDTCVSFLSSTSSFSVVNNGKAAPVFISTNEWPGVQRAADDFKSDIQKVVNNSKLDISSIEGQWEAFMTQVVDNPLPGIAKAYVIIGSDKRGTIYALYDHSEQFGVSPWYWWADVPVTRHSDIFVSASGCSHGSPTVKYRGIFLNDEQPALQFWAMENFTNGTGAALTGSPFNHLFYTKLFELLLRLKANYLWPAMWSSAFAVDDPQNQPLADSFDIVMGTR